MRASSVIRTAVATAIVAATLFVPAIAQARPAPLVISATGSTVTSNAVLVSYSLKGSAAVSVVVQKVRGASAKVATMHRRTGTGNVRWDRTINGTQAGPGRYVVTLFAKHGTAKSQSSITVTLN